MHVLNVYDDVMGHIQALLVRKVILDGSSSTALS